MASNNNEKVNDIEDFLELSNGELQFYLQQRGLPSSGTHGSLAARALIAYEQKVEVTPTAKQIASNLQSEYKRLLKKHDIPHDPLVESNDFIFEDDLKKWPKTNIGQIFSYFLDSKAFAVEYIGQYKLRKAYSFFGSGFVDKIFVRSLDENLNKNKNLNINLNKNLNINLNKNLTLIKSSVTPSQRINEDKHKLWILFSADHNIITAHCTCTAGFSQCCNHIAAVLYKIEYANEKGITDPACTEQLCNWNTAAKSVTPMKVKHMEIIEHNKSKDKVQKKFLTYQEKREFDPRSESNREVSEEAKCSFLAKARVTVPKASLNILFTPPPDKNVPLPLVDIAANVIKSAPKDLIDAFLKELSFNDSQLLELEKSTRSQSNSTSWWDQRKGRITASRFHTVHQKMQILYKNRQKSVKCKVTPLILDIVEPKELKNVPSLEWGKENENKALEAFMKVEGKQHKQPKLLPSGLFLFKPHPYIGATPDSIFICKCCKNKYCVECKCPYSIRDEDIETAWEKTSFLEKVDGKIQLQRSHQYYTQITGQMAITGHNQTYFVVYTTKGPPFIELITFDKAYWEKVLPSLIVFFKTYIQKYILCITEIFSCPMCDKPCLNENEFDSMEENSIQCDTCSTWFHWGCCGINDDSCEINDFICLLCQ